MEDPTAKKLIEIIQANIPDASPKSVTLDHRLDALGMDSLSLVETMFEIEEEYDIEIPEPEVFEEAETQFQTVNDLLVIVKKLISQKHEAES